MTLIAMASGSKVGRLAIVALFVACVAGSVAAQERMLALHVGRAWTVSGKPIDDAVILLENGKITRVGSAAEVEIPETADLLENPTWHVTPGFIHAYAAAFGMPTGDFSGASNSADRQIATDVKPMSWEVITAAAKAGFTRLNVVSMGGGFAGQGAFVHPARKQNRDPRADDILAGSGSCLAMGFDPKTSSKKFFREALGKATKAREDAAKPKKSTKAESKPESSESAPSESKGAESKPSEAAKDPKLSPLVDVLEKRLPGILGIRAPHGLLHMMPILKEFPAFRPILLLGPDCWRSLDLVKELGVPVILPTASVLRADTDIEIPTAVRFFDAGIPVALVPENPAPAFTGFAYHLAEVVRRGVSRDDVLRSVTLTPAEILGIQGEVGSLGAGKSADLLVWSGDPFAPSSRLLRVMVAGTVVHDSEEAP